MILLAIGLDNFIVNSCRQAFLKESRLPYFAIIVLLALILTYVIQTYRILTPKKPVVKKIYCDKCKKPMTNLGNISHMIYASCPGQWDDVYVCNECKTKKTIRKHGKMKPNYRHVDNYTEQVKDK